MIGTLIIYRDNLFKEYDKYSKSLADKLADEELNDIVAKIKTSLDNCAAFLTRNDLLNLNKFEINK